MHPITQRLALSVSALRTILRGIGRIHGYQRPTSLCRFVGQALPKLRPRRVVNGFSEAMVMYHAIDFKILYRDKAKAFNHLPRQLVSKIEPTEANPLMHSRHLTPRLGSLRRPPFAPSQLTLRFS